MNDEAISRYSTAKGYIQTSKMIVGSQHYRDENVIATFLSLHMLCAFALELYLKSWLLNAGLSSKQVRGHKHDLKRLFADASTKGLPKINSLEDLKDQFAGPHSDFTYRYMNRGDQFKTTDWNPAFRVLDELDLW